MADLNMSEPNLLQLIPYYQQQYANNGFPYLLMDLDYKIVDCNRAFLILTGYKHGEIIGRTFASLGINRVTSTGKVEIDDSVLHRKRAMFLISTREASIVTTATIEDVISENDTLVGYLHRFNIPATSKYTRQETGSSVDLDTNAVLRHELKNAVTNINVLMYLLARFTEPGGERYHRRMAMQIKRIEELITPSEKISSGITLHHVLQDTISLNMDRAREKNLDIVYVNAVEDASVVGSYQQLYTVTSNLISNAIKYTDVGEIIVVVRQDKYANTVEIEIRDTGMGIASEDLDQIFAKNYRAKNATDRDIEGQGLGLSLVKNIIIQLGGKIDIQSVEGQGTIVTFNLKQIHDDKT